MEIDYVLSEIHEGVCKNHTTGKSLAHKIICQSYYWPTLSKDAKELACKM